LLAWLNYGCDVQESQLAKLICAVIVLTMLVHQLDARKAYHGAAEPAGYQKYIPRDRRSFLEIEALPRIRIFAG
jgi:hypothetical protein